MIWELLETSARRDPEGVAVSRAEGDLTWGRILGRTTALAQALVRRGLLPGERVALLARNSAAFVEATFAVARAGGVLVPLNLRLAAREQSAVLADAGPRLILLEPEFEPLWGELSAELGRSCAALLLGEAGFESAPGDAATTAVPVPRGPGDPAFLYYTSGTTGRAKGVILTHGNTVAHARNAVDELSLAREDCWAHIAPMFHLADAWATLAVTAVGARHVFLPRFEAAAALALLEEQRVTLTNLVPTMLNDMTRHPDVERREFPHLRLLLSGGAPIAPSLVAEIETAFGCTYAQTYGLTETSPYLTISLLDERHRDLDAGQRRAARARTGRPFRGVEVQVVDDLDRPVPADDHTVGEVRARGATVTPGYWKRAEETASVLRDGWFYTGDLAVVDHFGSLRIVDRKKDMILTGAECVYCSEVEAVLFEHPGVHEAAVFGLPDPRWGEAVHAAVVPRPGRHPDASDLRDFCRERLANYKVPKHIHLCDSLPRLGSGKIAKRLLREEFKPSS